MNLLLRFLLVILYVNSFNCEIWSQSAMQRGFDLLDLGQYTQAESFFKEILNQEPDNKTAHICYNRSLGLGGNSKTALENFLALEEVYKGDKELLFNIAEAYMWIDDYSSAIITYRILLDRDPDSYLAHYGYANANAAVFSMDEARNHIRLAVAIKPEDEQAIIAYINIMLSSAHQAYSKGKMSEANNFLEELGPIAGSNSKYVDLLNLVEQGTATFISIRKENSWDSGLNQSSLYGLDVSTLLLDKHRFSVSAYRNALSHNQESAAIQQSFRISDIFQMTKRIRLNLGLTAYTNKFGDQVNTGLLKSGTIEGHWTANLYTNLSYENGLNNYSYQQLASGVEENQYSLAFNYLIKGKLGFYGKSLYKTYSDSNDNRGAYASLYYNFKLKPVFKIGLSYNYLSYAFRSQNYFSPQYYSATEIFLHADNKASNQKWNYDINLSIGNQRVDTNSKEFIYRVEVKWGRQIFRNWQLSMSYLYNSTVNATAVGEYAFNRAALLLSHTIKTVNQ